MGKRSDFERVERDYYQTPMAAVVPLIPFLPKSRFTFAEPCAGDGRLVKHIRELTDKQANCWLACDISPDYEGMQQRDALTLTAEDVQNCEMIITNPPWDRRPATGRLLHRMISHFSDLCPTWLLFDADWMHTAQAKPYLERMVATVSIGRVKWIEGSTMTGKDNCQWACFRTDARDICAAPHIFGRGMVPSQEFVRQINAPYSKPMRLAA